MISYPTSRPGARARFCARPSPQPCAVLPFDMGGRHG